MRVYYDDEERALLAARLGHAESVSDSDLAASVAAWIEGKPQPLYGRRLKPDDLEGIRAVTDWSEAEQEGGYANAHDGWLGQG
jgi:hypothetical protein